MSSVDELFISEKALSFRGKVLRCPERTSIVKQKNSNTIQRAPVGTRRACDGSLGQLYRTVDSRRHLRDVRLATSDAGLRKKLTSLMERIHQQCVELRICYVWGSSNK